MRKTIISLFLFSLGMTQINAQVGINSATPGSTLDVNGSLAAQYRAVTATTYAMNATDYHVSYNGTANSTFTLPTAISGVGNFRGRLYTIKNNTAFTVTVNPAASETIGGNPSISLTPNQSVQIINTGLTGTAVTWEVIAYNSTSGGVGCVADFIFATINGSQNSVQGNTNINFDLVKAGSGIALSNGIFTLKAGKTYELEGNLMAVNYSNTTGGYLSGQWVDASNNSSLAGSTVAELYPVSYTTTANNGIPIAKAVITPASDITVAFRILSSNGTAQIRGNQSYAVVKQLNACGGGGGSTTIVNNTTTASNGLNASANEVKLGGTLSQATEIANAGNNLSISGTGNLGVGTTTPANKVEINSGSSNQSGLRLSNLTSSSPASTGDVTALGINSTGDIVSLGSENTYKGLYVVNGVNPNNISYGGAGSTGTVNYATTEGYGGAPAAALTNAGVFTAPTAGVYRFDFSCAMINSNNPGNRMTFSFRKNNTTLVQSTAVGIIANGTIGAAFFTIQTMAAGETMSVFYTNDSGTNGVLSASNYIITRIQ
jgi:hypothetical protein